MFSFCNKKGHSKHRVDKTQKELSHTHLPSPVPPPFNSFANNRFSAWV